MYSGLLAKYISCPILIKFIFLTDFQKKNAQIPNFMKNRPVGAELFHANRQTKIETTKLSVSRFVILGTHLLQKKKQHKILEYSLIPRYAVRMQKTGFTCSFT